MTTWSVTQLTDIGSPLAFGYERDAVAFGFSRIVNDVGRWFLKVPANRYAITDFGIYNLMQFERKPDGGTKRTESVGVIHGREITQDSGGEQISVWGTCTNIILADRIVAYAAGTAYASKTDNADDIILAIARENLGSSSTDTARSMASYITIAPDAGSAPSLSRGFSWQNCLTVMQKIALASAARGTDLFFGVDVGRPGEIMFWAKTGQPGVDRTIGDTGLTLSPENGNLQDAYYSEDCSGEISYVYAGGNNTGTDRYISEVYNANRLNNSIWSRREAFQDARGQSNASVDAAAYERLYEGLPVARVGGRIVETERFRYGIEWGWGDKINVDYKIKSPGIVRGVAINVSGGVETIDARIEALVYTGGSFRQAVR